MRLRRAYRAASALSLVVVVASFPLLAARADAHETLPTTKLATAIRYGCDTGQPWVEVKLQLLSLDRESGSDTQTRNAQTHNAQNSPLDAATSAPPEAIQVGFTDTDGVEDRYLVGGPVQVVADERALTLRLAGAVASKVFITRLATNTTTVLPVPNRCKDMKPTKFGLKPVSVDLSAAACIGPNRAEVSLSVVNPNEAPNVASGHFGELDYTALVVRTADGMLATTSRGWLLRFDEPGTVTTAVQFPGDGAEYQIRIVGIDGSVVLATGFTKDCAPTTSSSPTSEPTLTQSPTATTSPSSSQSPSAPQSESPGTVQPSFSSVVNPPSPPRSSRSTSSASSTPAPATSEPSGTATPSHRPTRLPTILSGSPSTKSAFRFQPNAVIVVLVDALAIAGLVFATMQVAKRR